MNKDKKIDGSRLENILFTTFNTVFMIVLVVVTLYPFLNTIVLSLNDGMDSITGDIYLWPRVFTLFNYQSVFAGGAVVDAFFISVARTVISTVLNILLTTMLAYALSRKEYVFRKPITTVFVLTMYFNAGLIPNYFLIKSMGMVGSFWVYIVPGLIGAFNLIMIRTYIYTIPESLVESARIDGAGDFKIFYTIIFPLCRPVLATVGLFVAVGSWNSWFDTFLYNSSYPKLSTLQYELMKMLQSSMQQSSSASSQFAQHQKGGEVSNTVTPLSLRSAITVVAAVPIIIVYPFLQKHFVVGLNVGGVKE